MLRIFYNGRPISDSASFAEKTLLSLDNQCYVARIEVDDRGIRMLNGARMIDGHEFAVLDCEGELMGTGATAADAVESACTNEIASLQSAYDDTSADLARMKHAWQTLADGLGS